MFCFAHTTAWLLAAVVCGAPALASGPVDEDDRRIELPSPPSRKDRIELPSPPTGHGSKDSRVPIGKPGTCQNRASSLPTIQYGPRRVYSYRRDPDVAYSDEEITERHRVRMTRHYLSDDGVSRQHTVWVTPDFAARHGYVPDVTMIRHYYDRSGNQREQTVLVTREFAARWGYTPAQSGERASSTVARPSSKSD